LERLQKVMSRSGIASRRKSEDLILAGKVKVNGKIVKELGLKVDPQKDYIEVAGKPISKQEALVYLLLNKPKGYITTVKDTHDRKTVMDLIPKNLGRLYPVGRLDAQTKGLLLLTNDGNLTYKLTHPKFELDKTYKAKIKGNIAINTVKKLENGLILDDGPTAPAKVTVLEKNNNISIVTIKIHEGRNKQVRRMFHKVGHPVLELERISMGFLTLKGVPRGKYRFLSQREVRRLYAL
jgi:23S rRNA pseudouridine2605 synthase